MLARSVFLANGKTLALEPKQIADYQAEADTAIAELKGEVGKTDAVSSAVVE